MEKRINLNEKDRNDVITGAVVGASTGAGVVLGSVANTASAEDREIKVKIHDSSAEAKEEKPTEAGVHTHTTEPAPATTTTTATESRPEPAPAPAPAPQQAHRPQPKPEPVVETEPETETAILPEAEIEPAPAERQEPSERDVEVVGYERLADENGNEMDVAVIHSNGREIGVIDVDLDGEADFVVCDVNQNGVFEEGEVEVVHGMGIAMEPLQETAGFNPLFASNDLPDYVNDADVDEYMA